jgi:ribosomal protein L11 methyltransferase
VAPAAEAETAAAALLDLVPAGHELRQVAGGVELVVYVPAAELERLRTAFPAMRAEAVAPGWEDAWREFHVPVVVGPLWVGPPWETPPPDLAGVVIDPGRAFGTGAHPTTRLCLELLLELPRSSLLDVGCGSGVLAIAAARLGFAPVVAVDREADAVEATRRNAAANAVEINASVGDALGGELPAAETAVANIALEVLAGLDLRARLVITSGYFDRDDAALPGFRHVSRRRSEGWAADVFARV